MPLYAVFLLFALLFLWFGSASSYAQQKHALVIGNGTYTNLTRLNNPANDARDMKAALESLGFTVELVVNGALDQMESAAMRLRNRLSAAQNSYGFFFYAGHAVQSGGENYLIPVDANIQSENFLRQKAVSVQAVLSELNDARNVLNIVVLDACRDNPFSWKRSGSRGLQPVSDQPADSIIVYATSAGNTADDNPSGKNGLFTTYLLANLKTPGLSVRDLFDKTGADVRRASGGKQIPVIYSQFFETAYLGNRPSPVQPVVPPSPAPQPVPVPERSVQSYFDSAQAFYSWGDYAMAIEEYTQAIRLDPNFVAAYNNRGNAYYSKKDYDRAISDYTQAIRLNPDYEAAYNNRASAYYSKKDYDRAIADCIQAIRLNPDYEEAYINRASAYYSKNDYDRAIADYTQVIRLDPNFAVAYENRGNVYYSKEDYDRAIADFTQAIRINPDNANIYHNRGTTYYYKEDYDRAIADFEAALRIEPNHPYAGHSLESARRLRGY
jgi:tetratricopeptide (TPR) repeat protein